MATSDRPGVAGPEVVEESSLYSETILLRKELAGTTVEDLEVGTYAIGTCLGRNCPFHLVRRGNVLAGAFVFS